MSEQILKCIDKKKSKIIYKNLSRSISYYGYPLDILKSAVQKYLRRREFEKMIWVVAEIYLFQLFPEKKGIFPIRNIMTNLLNRIIIMLDEEMVFTECTKYLLVRDYMDDFEKTDRSDFSCLYKICKILSTSKMIRRNEDIRGFWDDERRCDLVTNPVTSPVTNPNVAMETDDYYFQRFKDCFEKKDSTCFKWMFKIFNKKEEGNVTRFRSKENIYMIWKYLFSRKNIKENEQLRKCLLYRLLEFKKKNRSERFIFLTAAIDITMNMGNTVENKVENTWFMTCAKSKVDKIKQIKKNYDEKYTEKEVIQLVFNNRKKLIIDDYAIDMHTLTGRQMGKNKKDFIDFGSVVIREDKEYFVKEWRDVYNNIY